MAGFHHKACFHHKSVKSLLNLCKLNPQSDNLIMHRLNEVDMSGSITYIDLLLGCLYILYFGLIFVKVNKNVLRLYTTISALRIGGYNVIQLSEYIVNEKIYEGGETVVYRGTKKSDGFPVLIKTYDSAYAYDSAEKMKHEFDINQKIESSHIVKIYGIEQAGNIPFLIMEDFGGDSLRQILRVKKLCLGEFLEIAIKISTALADIHKYNIIHNDINPSNIIINTETGAVKIIDFGNAVNLSDRSWNSTKKRNVTLNYISPEKTGRINRSVDHRSDYYSLGVSLYEMIVGHLPFQAEDEIGLIYSHLARESIPPKEADSSIPEVLSDIIMKLMEKMPENRYQSAVGIKSDLQICLDQLETYGEIKPFPLGSKDISSRFQIPQKLYGRKQEIEMLVSRLDQVSKGSAEIVTIKGYSGIGKSSLVKEIQRHVIKNLGFFTIGKFDQLRHHISYSALIEALRGIINQIVSESMEQVEIWKAKLLQALGPNGRIIADVIPEVEIIIGNQPHIPELPPMESQNRFNMVFQNFIECFSSEGHPLIIFLDDIQWADSATLKLIEVLMSNAKHMLIIAAYRDNEVYSGHPLMLALDSIKIQGIAINVIDLQPLELNNISEMLSEIFCCDIERVNSFAELCLKKTEGNPFFLNQFLHFLYEDKLIWFDVIKGVWQWDLEAIQNAGITDNVVELMVQKIKKLPAEAQKILTMAACIGNRFDAKMLAIVCEKPIMEIFNILKEVYQEGLILIEGNSYPQISAAEDINLDCRFLHDRIQQAAYSFIEEGGRKEVHLKLGRLILSGVGMTDSDENLFDIVNHYNLGIELIHEIREKEMLVQLELFAGRKAKKAVAYNYAYKYFKYGLGLLQENCWQVMYDIAFALYIEVAETAYLIGNFDEMEEITQIVIRQANNVLDKVKAYTIKIQAYTAQDKNIEAKDLAYTAIKQLGINIPKNPGKLGVLFKILKAKLALLGKNIDELAGLPAMTDPKILMFNYIIAQLMASLHRSDINFYSVIVLEAVTLFVKHGNAPYAAAFYGSYGFIMINIGDIDLGYKFAKLSQDMMLNNDIKELKSPILALCNGFVSHWKIHAKHTLPYFKEGYQSGLDVGNYEYAAYNGAIHCGDSYLTGKNLEQLEKEALFFLESVKKLKQGSQISIIGIWCQAVQNLRGKNENPVILCGDTYNEKAMLPNHNKSNHKAAICSVYINKLILCCLFEKYDAGAECGNQAKLHISTLQASKAAAALYFYDSLVRLAMYDEVPFSVQKNMMQIISFNQKKMKKWAQHAPMNFLHKYYLVEAEKSRVQNKYYQAAEYYNNAIELAAKNEYVQDEAYANELTAKFYLSRQNIKLAGFYMREAYRCYITWGATAKVRHLEAKYPKLIFSSSSEKKDSSSMINRTKPASALFSLDTATIVKATQIIFGEIIMEELLKKLVYILLENAGAQRVVYIHRQNGIYMIQAEGWEEKKGIVVMQEQQLEETTSIPKNVINYVQYSKESVILDNACTSESFMNDPYVSFNKPKSVLCVPILNKGEIYGIVYLENNLIEGAFNEERIEVLRVISSQFAISMENARMYKKMEVFNAELESIVQERTEELRISNQLLLETNRKLEKLSSFDGLTGISNRRSFNSYIEIEWKRAVRESLPISIIMIDVDFFKKYNDNYGHIAGDECLKQVASVLSGSLHRPADFVARYGGEEFVVVLPDTDSKGAAIIAEKIRKGVEALAIPHDFSHVNKVVSASLGATTIVPTDNDTLEEFLHNADMALFKAKESGRNRLVTSIVNKKR